MRIFLQNIGFYDGILKPRVTMITVDSLPEFVEFIRDNPENYWYYRRDIDTVFSNEQNYQKFVKGRDESTIAQLIQQSQEMILEDPRFQELRRTQDDIDANFLFIVVGSSDNPLLKDDRSIMTFGEVDRFLQEQSLRHHAFLDWFDDNLDAIRARSVMRPTSGAGLKSDAPSLEQSMESLKVEAAPLQRSVESLKVEGPLPPSVESLTGGDARSGGGGGTGLARTSGGESGLARRGGGLARRGGAAGGGGAGENSLARRGGAAGGGGGAGESSLARRQEYLSRVVRNQELSHTIESRIGRLTDAKTQKELGKLYGTRKRDKWESALRKLGTLEKPSGGSHFHFTYNGRTLSVPLGHDKEFGFGLHQTMMKELLEFFEAV